MAEPVYVESLSHFLRFVENAFEQSGDDFRQNGISGATHFRGHSDKSYRMVPNLYRPVRMGDEINNRFYEHEQVLIQDALQLVPSEFLGLSRFQQLCKMQHLGLPTRLLDVTMNPLVALYFATSNSNRSDGEVIYIPPLPVFDEAHTVVQDLVLFSFQGDWNGLDLASFGVNLTGAEHRWEEESYADYAERTFGYPITIVTATYSNPRIRAQSGAFLTPGMEVEERTERQGKVYSKFSVNLRELSRLQDMGFPGDGDSDTRYRLIIPADRKREVRRQLNRVGINESTLFPEPEHQMRFIAEAYRQGHRGLHFGWEKKFTS